MPDVGSMCQLFADDAKLYRSIILPEDNRKLQNDLGKINEWSTRWQPAAATKKANGVLGLLKKSFTLLDKITLPLLSLVRPHLEYDNVVWGPH